ncbi:MAG: hypothetical protein ACI39U_09335, partial [Candidatus Cryptobacteroides sp.]
MPSGFPEIGFVQAKPHARKVSEFSLENTPVREINSNKTQNQCIRQNLLSLQVMRKDMKQNN